MPYPTYDGDNDVHFKKGAIKTSGQPDRQKYKNKTEKLIQTNKEKKKTQLLK
jgi:hypothetical protein